MIIKLEKNESIKIETDRHKAQINSDRGSKISFEFKDKKLKIEDLLVEKQINELLIRNDNWNTCHDLGKPVGLIRDMVERGSNALRVDKNKLCSLIIESCNYSMINYFQESNFLAFEDPIKLRGKINALYGEITTMKKSHEKEIIDLQRKLMEAKKISTEKKEVDGDVSMDLEMWASCPFCDHYQLIETDDWYQDETYCRILLKIL